MSEYLYELLAIYASRNGGHNALSSSTSLSEATGRRSARLSEINQVLHGSEDRDTLYLSLLDHYGGEEYIPLDVLIALFPGEEE